VLIYISTLFFNCLGVYKIFLYIITSYSYTQIILFFICISSNS